MLVKFDYGLCIKHTLKDILASMNYLLLMSLIWLGISKKVVWGQIRIKNDINSELIKSQRKDLLDRL